MSWWTKIRDVGEGVLTGGIAGLWNKNIGNWEGSLFNKVTGRPNAAQQRAQQQQIQDQVKAYQDQTNLERKQIDDARSAEESQKRLIQQKQIRNLRRSYRAPGSTAGVGMLGQGQPPTEDTSKQLGG